MKRNIRSFLFAILVACISVSCIRELEMPENNIPMVSVKTASSVSTTMAKLTGVYSGDNASSVYFLVSTTDKFISAYTKKVKAELSDGFYSATVLGLTPLTTYYYKFCVENLLPFDKHMLHRESTLIESDVKTFITSKVVNENVLSEQIVDLGLSVKWAAWNIGATKPEEYGNYYAWGETEVKDVYTLETYKFYENGSYINIGTDISATSYDVAYVEWGDGWRMPTLTELQELRSMCQWSWTYIGDVRGFRITGPNGKTIFFPAAGFRQGSAIKGDGANGGYWSSSLNVSNGGSTCGLSFDYAGAYWYDDFNAREFGFTVRAVKE